MPNPETTRKLYDEMDFQRAVQTYLSSVCLRGYPAVSFESIRLTVKQDFHAAVLATAAPDRLLGGGHFTPFG
jgi:hypothetical protein